jgi:endonuclease/exonuclease/phosphatase (EEP) superfamily protein YafD
MAKFLFWNLNKQPRENVVARIAQHHDVDVVILAECVISDEEVLGTLNRESDFQFCKLWSESSKIQIFTRLPEISLAAVFDDNLGRLTIRRLAVTGSDILLAAVHFPSKVNWSDEEQRAEMQNLASEIVRTEDSQGHRRTLLVGDFNMNPFEKGMISSHGLHAVMTRKIANKQSWRVSGKEYLFFYNPMWRFFGDGSDGTPGTFYFRKPTPDVYFWNILIKF